MKIFSAPIMQTVICPTVNMHSNIQKLMGATLPYLHITNTFVTSIHSCNAKISALSRSGNIKAARKLFDEMSTRDVVSWNAIITGYWQNGFFQESKTLFESMTTRNVVSWNSMISGCVENGRTDDAYDYFKAMPDRNVASYNTMISGFLRDGRIEEGARLFEVMPMKDVISYTAMIGGYLQVGEVERARVLFDCMPCRNVVSWTVMISGYIENGRFEEAWEIYHKMPNRNVVAMTAMITGCCKEGRMEEARCLFEEIQCKDCISFNAMITGYAQNGKNEEALKLLSQMLQMGVQPDDATMVSALTACSNLASQNDGRQSHTLLLKYGLDSHVHVCNAVITMYSRCGLISESISAFHNVINPNNVSWSTIISAFAQHGLYESAVAYFKKMESNGFEPNELTFLSLLSACGHAGMVNESMHWFESMERNYKVMPTSEHYACLVDILARAGQVEKAYTMIRHMHFEADSGVWGALLAGCRANLNVELGEIAAKKVMELEPKKSSGYVMLSNIYAAAGKWKEVTRVRGLMKQYSVKKQPAYSWMDIGKEVHYFLGGDISHPAIKEIRAVLKQIRLQMEDIEENREIVFI